MSFPFELCHVVCNRTFQKYIALPFSFIISDSFQAVHVSLCSGQIKGAQRVQGGLLCFAATTGINERKVYTSRMVLIGVSSNFMEEGRRATKALDIFFRELGN